ncbi:hypothetical protein H5410_008052 [Solanum commersonii]|uniref:Uncharacterized protein n=1 Tax=Solanum commersonii TaxID=4109 RepID=A0A9J6AFF0_SOLCO|nr:hypothetical protein H5410_008052 [Solanum commersonii]
MNPLLIQIPPVSAPSSRLTVNVGAGIRVSTEGETSKKLRHERRRKIKRLRRSTLTSSRAIFLSQALGRA